MRHVLVALLGALVALPGAALATHMGQYANDPLERDLQGQVAEPDGVVTSVLGPRVANCVVELPSRDGFEGRCQGEPRGTGLQPDGAIAPGCTGADANSQPVRRLDGQCGLWDVGAPRPNGVWAPVAGPQLGPGRIAPPISERGMGAGAYPGRYAGPVRFLDARLDADFVQNAATGGPTWVRDYNQLLQDLAGGGMTPTPLGAPLPPAEPLQPFAGAVLPGQHYVWAWYGQWDDRNGNGVVDHCFGGCHPFDGAGINEFAWLGSCMAFEDLRVPEAISAGICIEDPNPNLDPPGMPCADPGSLLACAGTTMAIWVWPGNHHGNGMTGDMPLSQPLFSWINTGKPLNCSDPPTCDDEDLAYNGDPLLGRQDEVAADGTYHDRTGDGADDGDDTARQWSGYLGGDSTYYGDDGLLVTMVQVTGVNCAATDGATGYDLRAHAGGPGGCTFVDVDKYPTVSPFAEHLLVGDPEEPTSGLKAIGRSAWIMVRERGPGLMKTIDAVQNGALTYQLTQGSLRGKLDDQFVDPGWSREPNSPPRTVVNGLTGESLTVAEQFVGATYRSCEDFPVGDARNPTAEPDLASLEAQHRGNCNVYQDGTADPYRDYRATASGWIDITSYRGLTMNNPVTLIAPPCTFCFWSSPIDIPAYPETPTTPPDLDPPEDHTRTLPAGRYYFHGWATVWHDKDTLLDESVFPDPYGTTTVNYPADGWLGAVAETTGQFEYRGFKPVTCTTERDGPFRASLHTAAECNPYLDGNEEYPQGFEPVDGGGEVGTPLCSGPDPQIGSIFLAPVDGVMDTQVIVWRDYGAGIGPLPHIADLENYGPGPVAPLEIRIVFFGCYSFIGGDFLYMPLGNMKDDVVTWVSADVPRPGGEVDHVTDVDFYADWEPDVLP